jgi:hypothetical protein
LCFSKVDLCVKSRRGARERPTSTGGLPLAAKGAPPSSSPSLLLSTAMIGASCLLPPSQNYCPTCVQTTRLSSNNFFSDLGFFRTIQLLQYQQAPNNIDELIEAVVDSFIVMGHDKLKNVFLSAVPYRGHEMRRRRKQLQTSPREQGEDGSTWPSPGHHCLSIGTLQHRTRAYEHGLITTGQYKWDAKKS